MDAKTRSPSDTSPSDRGPMGRRGLRPTMWQAWHATKLARWVRLGTFLMVALGGTTWLIVHRTEAQLSDDLMGAGSALMRFTDADDADGPRVINVNGERVHVASGSSEETLAEVMDAFEAICLERDGDFTEQLHALAAERPAGAGATFLEEFHPVFRSNHGDERGVVACLDLGDSRRTPEDILDSYDRFQENGDLHEIGDIRYLFAQRAGEHRTHFVSLWTEGSFHPDHVLPGNSDAPGDDLAGLPRPPRSRRTLAAFQEGREDRFVMYEGSSMTEWELEAWYHDELEAQGWTLTDVPEEEGRDARLVLAMREGRQLYVTLDTDEFGDGSAILMLSE